MRVDGHELADDAAAAGGPEHAHELGVVADDTKDVAIQEDGVDAPTLEALDAFCREELAGYKCPRSYDFVPDVGRNTMGKINKRKLRAPYWPSERSIG